MEIRNLFIIYRIKYKELNIIERQIKFINESSGFQYIILSTSNKARLKGILKVKSKCFFINIINKIS